MAEPDELAVRCSMPYGGSEFFVKCGALNGFSAKTVNPTLFRNYINGFKRPFRREASTDTGGSQNLGGNLEAVLSSDGPEPGISPTYSGFRNGFSVLADWDGGLPLIFRRVEGVR